MAIKDYRIGLFDRLNGDSFGLSDDDKDRATRQGLLGLAAGLLGTGGGFGNALGAGIQTGLLAMNQGADNVVNDRYRQAMMQRTMQGAERNARAEELAKRFYGPDGKPDMAVARELATINPEMAKSLLEFGQPEQERWSPTDITDPNNPNNVLSVFHNGRGQLRYPDGTPVFGGESGPLAGAAPQAPEFGLLSNAVEQVESGGNPNAVSPKGAIGPMQTMPGTLMDPGFGVTPARDNSVEEQRRVGQDYLKALTERYGVTGGLAAYNWGPGNWDRALASNNNDVSAALSGAPAETRAYVPKVMDRMGGGAAPTSSASRFSRPRYKPEGEGGGGRNAPSGYSWNPDGTLAPIPGGPADRKANPTPADQAKDERQMRQELTSLTKEDQGVVNAYQRVEAAARQPSAAGDLSLIFGYMKMLDPGSVVREGEFANAQNAAGVPERIANLYNNAMKGERLNPAQREQFVNEAKKLHDLARARIANKTIEYADIAEQYGYDAVRATGQKLAAPSARERFNSAGQLLKEAREAIQQGAPRDAVRQRLIEQGYTNIAGRL